MSEDPFEDDDHGGYGHNSGSKQPDVITAAAQNRLRSFVERIERLESDKAEIAADIKDVYAELRGEGFDAPTVRKIVSLRKADQQKLAEKEALLDLYIASIGGL